MVISTNSYVAEMLTQSHDRNTSTSNAKNWGNDLYQELSQYGFEVDMQWKDGALKEVIFTTIRR